MQNDKNMIHIRVNDELKQRIAAAAEKRGVKISPFIASILWNWTELNNDK